MRTFKIVLCRLPQLKTLDMFVPSLTICMVRPLRLAKSLETMRTLDVVLTHRFAALTLAGSLASSSQPWLAPGVPTSMLRGKLAYCFTVLGAELVSAQKLPSTQHPEICCT